MVRLVSHLIWFFILSPGLVLTQTQQNDWWSPGDGKPFAELVPYSNAYGFSSVLNTGGAFENRGHPFFKALGTNV